MKKQNKIPPKGTDERRKRTPAIRTTALLLAMLMVLPLIDIPVVAADDISEEVNETESSSDYLFSADFNGEPPAFSIGVGTEFISFPEGSGVMRFDIDTYDEETGLDTKNVKAIDQNLRFKDIPAVAPTEEVQEYYFEVDFYIPQDAEFYILSHIRSVIANGGSTYNWIPLYSIKANGATAEFIACERYSMEKVRGEQYYRALPVGEWFTLTNKIDLATGEISQYINGILYAQWYLLIQANTFLTDITVKPGASGGWIPFIAVKIDKFTHSTTPGYEVYWTGHGGNYPNGYSGFLMMDNFEIYDDPSLFTEKHEKPTYGPVGGGSSGDTEEDGDDKVDDTEEKVSDHIQTQNPSLSVKDFCTKDHGNVFYFDMTKGPTDDGKYYLIGGKDSERYSISSYTRNDDGTYNGKVTVTRPGENPTHLMFQNAVLETEKIIADDGSLANPVQLYTTKFVSTGKTDSNTGELIYEEQPDELWTDFVGSLANCATANAIQGGGNINMHSYFKHSEILAATVSYSMDYYIDHDWKIATDVHAMKGDFGFVTFARNGNSIEVRPHKDLTLTDGGTVLVATDCWFKITVVADYETATVKVYINGNYVFTAVNHTNVADILSVAGNIPADSLQIMNIQCNQGETSLYNGYLMVDNVTLNEGEVVPEAYPIPEYLHSYDFDSDIPAYDFGTGADSVSIDGAIKIDLDTYDEETGEDTANVMALHQFFTFTDLPALASTEESTEYFFEADYYIPKGAEFSFSGRLKKVTCDQGTYHWVPLYLIKANGSTATLSACGDYSISRVNGTDYYNKLPMGEWFTLTHKINLVTGVVSHYVNGVLYAEWYLVAPGLQFLTNITISAGKNGWIIVQPNRLDGTTRSTTPGYENYCVGHGGNYPNGYSGFLMIDNLKIYNDPSIFIEKSSEMVIQEALSRIIETEDLASIRLSNPTGLRFATRIDTEAIAQLEALGVTINGYGTLIAPTDFMNVLGELNLETYTAGKNIIQVEAEMGSFFEVDGDERTTHFVGSIVDMVVNDVTNNIIRSFSARGYINITLADGTTFNLYSSFTKTVSVREVALATLYSSSQYEEGSTYHSVLNSYAIGRKPTSIH